MADVNNDVLVLGACIMDFVWLVLSYSIDHYNHPRCIIMITCFVFLLFFHFTVMLIICRKRAKQLKERNLRLDMEVNVTECL